MLRIKSFLKKFKLIIDQFYLFRSYLSNSKRYKLNLSKSFVDYEKVHFIYRSKYKESASTIMRCFQFQKILKNEGGLLVDVLNEEFISDLKDSICILNKSFLINATPREFEILLSNNNIICLDYIDSLPRLFHIKYAHSLIASSINQKIYFLEKFKNKLIKFIPHNVDPRIKQNSENNFLNIAYFGEKDNGLYLENLSNLIDSYFINTKKTENKNWINNIDKYNAHYIIRRNISKNIFKPFLKGFTAAHNNANVIAYIKDGDSFFYLGKDYPYLIKDISLKNVLNLISYMNESYKSKEWYYGLEIMREVKEKSSNQYIINEFKDYLKSLRELS